MKVMFLCKNTVTMILLAVACAALSAEESNSDSGGKLFSLGLLESGSWTGSGNFVNRLDLRLYAPWGFQLRGQLSDRIPVPPWEHTDDGVNALGVALYHKGTGSRLIYGLIETRGLLNRTRNVWLHSAPWFESHSLSTADLKTSAGEMEDANTYIELLSPAIGPVNASISMQFDGNADAIFLAGAGLRLPFSSNVRFEGLITERPVAERKNSSWFSDKPYLPERKLRFFAFNATFTNRYFCFTGDFARSEIFAWGEGVYANAALRGGAGPWSLSFAADGTDSRFSAADGSIPGAGFRGAAKFEWEGRRNMLFRVSSTLRAAAPQEPFDRSSTSVYYRLPLNKSLPVRFKRLSFTMERDARNYERIDDSLGLGAALSVGPLHPTLSVNLDRHTSAKIGARINPFPDFTARFEFDSFKFSGALSCQILFVSLKGTINYTLTDEKPPLVTNSISVSVSGKYGRIGLKLSGNAETGDLEYTLSWRFQKTF
ncbi:MAG: hypothetical protein LBD86_02210 [Spirochaetaceae bacterium]|jgi:hypothetical protein|nr:hypothetical protein [Spirochaetaceae bacterium]